MSPGSPATARRTAPGAAPRRQPAAGRRPSLRIVDAPARRRSFRRSEHRLVPTIVSAGLLAGSLSAVVVGHALLAQGQVRLAVVQSDLTKATTAQVIDTKRLSALTSPPRLTAAGADAGLVDDGHIDQVPYVPLDKALPAPTVKPAPTPTPSSPSPGNTSQATSPTPGQHNTTSTTPGQ